MQPPTEFIVRIYEFLYEYQKISEIYSGITFICVGIVILLGIYITVDILEHESKMPLY